MSDQMVVFLDFGSSLVSLKSIRVIRRKDENSTEIEFFDGTVHVYETEFYTLKDKLYDSDTIQTVSIDGDIRR